MLSEFLLSPTSVDSSSGWSVNGAGSHLAAVTDGLDSSWVQNSGTSSFKIQFQAIPQIDSDGVVIEGVFSRVRRGNCAATYYRFFIEAASAATLASSYSGSPEWHEEDFTANRPGGGQWAGADFNGNWYTSFQLNSGVAILYECRARILVTFPAGAMTHIIEAMGIALVGIGLEHIPGIADALFRRHGLVIRPAAYRGLLREIREQRRPRHFVLPALAPAWR